MDKSAGLNLKTIPLTQNKLAIVDDSDYEFLSQFKWCASKQRKDNFHAISGGVSMHRTLLKPTKRHFVDHINGNGLDNRRQNLRLALPHQNSRNSSHPKRNAKKQSIYKGVHWRPKPKLWQAKIVVRNKTKHLGYFKLEKDAGVAYNKAANKFFKKFAKLNTIKE